MGLWSESSDLRLISSSRRTPHDVFAGRETATRSLGDGVHRAARHNPKNPGGERSMRKLRKLGTAVALSAFIGAGMITFSATVHAAGADRSVQVRCALLQRAIDAAIATFGADSQLVAYLQGEYATYCSQ